MASVAPVRLVEQDKERVTSGVLRASANGGVLLLARVWAALVGGSTMLTGVRWQGQGGSLLLFALVALPLLGPQSVLGVSAWSGSADSLLGALGWAKALSQRRLARFVGSVRHDWLGGYRAVLQGLLQQSVMAIDGEWPKALVVDSTTIEKRYGRRLAGLRPVWDAVQHKLVDGYEVVSSCLVDAEGSCPVGLLPHQKSAEVDEREKQRRRRRKARAGELPSKLDLALELVGVAIGAGVVGLTVVGDSGFAVMWFLREIAGEGLEWLVSTRKDRRLRIGTAVAAFEEWASGAVLSCLETDKHGGGVWGGLLGEATLLEKGCRQKGLTCRPVYCERRDRLGKVRHRWYLVTSHLEWDLAMVWRHWGWRWQIEVWHRVWKQQLQVTQFHVRSWAGISTLLACSSLRASLMVYLRAMHPAWQSLSLQRLIEVLCQMACLVEVVSDAHGQVSRPDLLPDGIPWHDQPPPLPPQWWPITLIAA